MIGKKIVLNKRMGLYYVDWYDLATGDLIKSDFATVTKDNRVTLSSSTNVTHLRDDRFVLSYSGVSGVHNATLDYSISQEMTLVYNSTTFQTDTVISPIVSKIRSIFYSTAYDDESHLEFGLEFANEFFPLLQFGTTSTECDSELIDLHSNLMVVSEKLNNVITSMSENGLSAVLSPTAEIDILAGSYIDDIQSVKDFRIASIATKLSVLENHLLLDNESLPLNLNKIIGECRLKAQNYEPDPTLFKDAVIDYFSVGVQSYLSDASLDGSHGSAFLDGTFLNMQGCDNKYKVLGSRLITISPLLNTYVYLLEYVDIDGKFLDENSDSLLTEKVIPILDENDNPVLDGEGNPTFDVEQVPVSMPTLFSLGSALSLSVG